MYKFWFSFIFYGLCMLKIEGADPRFGEKTSGPNYSQLDNNTILFASTTVFCITDNNTTEITWTYQATQTGIETTIVTTPIWDPSTGTSTLEINITSSGYYGCNVENQSENITYIFGVFNPDEYGVTSRFTGHFTNEIDDINLLCDPQSDLIYLFDVRWRISSQLLPNPLNLNNISDDVLLVNQDNELLCVDQSSFTSLALQSVTLRVQGPPAITLRSDTTNQHNLLPPEVNSANVRILTPNVTLETNITGNWSTPAGTEIQSKSVTVTQFTINEAGLYRFYVTNWEGNQALAIQISLSVSGSNFGEVLQGSYRLLSGNEIFYTATLLVCATSNTTSQPVQWKRRLTQTSATTNIPVAFSTQNGTSFLSIAPSSEGYYTCQVGDQSYDVAIFNHNNTIIVTAAMSGMSYYYAKGIDSTSILLLCDVNSRLDTIKWSISGNITENPLNLNNLNNLEGTSSSCQVGATSVVFTIMLTVYEPSLTANYPGSSLMTFTNLSSVENAISIPFFTKQIQLTTNLVSGTWILPNGSLVLTSSYTIPILTLTTEGRYSFNTTQTWNGENKQVFILDIASTGIPFATRQSQEVYTPQSNNVFFYQNQELVCLTDPSTQVTWNYQQTAKSGEEPLIATTNSEGISVLNTSLPNKQGFYSCNISNNGNVETYFAGIFDPTRTTEIQEGGSYNYVNGIDGTDIWMVCDPKNSEYDLSEVYFDVHETTIGNPINFHFSKHAISPGPGNLNCFYKMKTNIIITATLLFQEPSLTTSYPGSSAVTLNNLNPVKNAISVPFFTKQIQLTTNLVSGTWILPNGALVLTSSYTIPILTLTTERRYSFNTTQTWNEENKQVFILDIVATGIPFATQSQEVYTSQSNNTFFYQNQDLVCLTDSGTKVAWNYQLTVSSSKILLTATTDSEGISVSTTLLPTQQGFYSCSVTNKGKSETYFAGVFDPLRTTEIQEGRSYSYTVGVDSADIWLVCNPKNSNYDLRDVWFSVHGFRIGNPINFNLSAGSISQGHGSFKCFYQMTTNTIVTATFLFQGPPVITLTADSTTTHSLLPPSTNTASVRVLSQNVTLQTNLIGKWKRPDNTEVTSDNITFPEFTANHTGLYQLYVTSWNGSETLAIQIRIIATGTNFAVLTSQGNYMPLVSNIFYIDTTLVCATNDTSQQIQWCYRLTQTSTVTNRTGSSQWNANTGISTLDIMTSSEGYYSCQVLNHATYIAAIFNAANTIKISPEMTEMSYSYVKEIDPINILLLCDLESSAVNLNTAEWTDSSTSYNNPLILNELNAMNEVILTCKVGASSVTPSVTMSIFGPPVITLTADSTSTYSLLPPSTNTASVRVLSQNVNLQTNLIGKWRRPDNNTEVSSDNITFPVFTASDAGLYQFYVTSWNGSETLAIQIILTVTGINFAMMTSQGNYIPLLNNEIFYTDTALVCATNDTSQQIEWTYQPNQTATASSKTTSSRWDASTGISILEIMTSEQGYYSCQAGNLGSYDSAIFNTKNTIVVTVFIMNYYVKGIDPTNILLLCDLNNPNVPLKDVRMTTQQPATYNNPIILNDLNPFDDFLLCANGNSGQFLSLLSVIDPLLTLNYNGFNTTTTLSQNTITLIIPLFSKQVLLSTNFEVGIWTFPNSSTAVDNITIPSMTKESEGRYVFNTSLTWNGISTQVFILQITSTGVPFGIRDSQGSDMPVSNNTFFYEDTELVCITDTNTEVTWYYQPTSKSNRTFLDYLTNVASIETSINKQGFYSCDIINDTEHQTYRAGVFDLIRTTILSSDTTYNYTIDVDSRDLWLLCDANYSNMSQSEIFTVNGTVVGNPLNLYNFTEEFDSLRRDIVCNNRTGSLQSAQLYIQGPPNITLNYDNNMMEDISDISTVTVPLFAQNVTLTTNILGNWNVGYGKKSDVITINTFSLSNKGLYYFATEYTWNGVALNASVFDLVTSGIPIAIKTGDVYNTAIVNNQILFESVTLACTSEAYPITWNYLQSSNAGFRTEDESSSTLNGISTLDVNANKQGFYSCNIQENSSNKRYTIGIFDSMTTTVALSGVTYNYTIGVDREDIFLLCDPKSDSINFNDVVWRLGNSNINLPNPLSVNDSKEELSFKDNEDLLCYNIDTNTEIQTYRVFVQGPPIIAISYSNTKYMFSLSNLTSITIPLLTSSIEVSINLRSGEWRRGLINSSGTYPTIQIDLFTAKHIGVYNYIFNFIDGREKEISVEITAIGPVLAVKNTTGYFVLQNNAIGELNTELACFASNQDVDANSINWYYQEDIPSDPQIQSGEYNDQLGATSINVVKEGIYTCRLQDNMLLSVWILELDENTQILSNEDFDRNDEMTYIIGDSLTLFYQNPTVSLTAIRWTTGRVQNGDTDTIMEFYNNIEISDVFAQLGSGAYAFSCFYRQSPITVVGDLNLNMKDTAATNLTYNSVMQEQFSDVINANFPRPQSISIPILTEKIKLTCNISMCEWLMQRNGTADYSVSDSEYLIDVLKIENQGLYSLRRKTSADVTYSTGGFMLTVTGFTRQSIISLNHSDINIRPITLFWELETVLPDEANQTFAIFYTENSISYINTTTDTTFNLTNLIPGQTYTVYVTLFYAYTLETSNRSVVIMVPPLPQVGILLAAIIPAFLFLMIVLVIIIIILLIIIIFKMRKRKGNAFTTLDEGNAIAKTSNSRNSKEFGYTTLDTQLDNPVYNPDLTESMTPKSKFPDSDPMMQEEKTYYNMTDINDPRLRPIPLDVFKRHVDQLWEKEDRLEEEYDSLGGDSFRYTCDKAQIAINKYKNKYKFIYPYDKSRVVLKKKGRDAQSDYINASHIPGLYVPQCFIASQGPKENTLEDFWRMIFEQNIVNIVMVTNLKEGDKQKCEAYFPENRGERVEYGPYKLNNMQTDISIGNITRMFKVESSKEKVLVKHFHFTAWPDHDVPTLYDELLVFVETVQETMIPSKAPILVHCSAGVGRTGTFITLFNLRSAINRKQPISIYQVVHEMREHRPHMVQTFRQYKFIYLAVLELLLGKTSIPAEDFTNTYNSYLESDQDGYVSVFFQQFSELNYQCKKSFYLPTNAADNNPEKNPSGEIVPFDYNRVVIYSPFFPCDYINASYHEGNQFITTIHPDAYTLVDFLQMVYQTEAALVVMLATSKEKSKILGNMSDRKAYWPNKDASLNVPPFEVSVTNSEKSTALIKQTILLKNNSEKSERTFMQVISTAWNEKGETTDLQSILILLNFIIKYKHENPSKPIIIHCQDGIGKTGIVYTVYQCIQEIKEKGQIDIFHTIKRLRRERINFVPTLTHFCSCFAVLNEYCSST